jgi:DNA-binding SARP family transcriptional activator/tetratricopeptide (TPR) repeat protein
MAILAILAAAGERGISRESLAGLLWPDAAPEHSRHSLRQALYALRHDLGSDVVRAGAQLSLDRNELTSDIGAFRAALAGGDRAGAAALVGGPFLQGFFLAGAPEFERWVDEQRIALIADAVRVVRAAIRDAEAAGDSDVVVEWWRRLTMLDPLSGRDALGLLKALAARGDRAGALAFARAHETVIRRELEADPDPEIRRLEAELRAIPSPAVIRVAPALAADGAVTHAVEPGTSRQQNAASVADAASSSSATRVAHRRQLRWSIGGPIVVAAIVVAAFMMIDRWRVTSGPGAGRTAATFAVGMIRDEGVADSLRFGGVMTDMLATNLARVAGISVLANSRLMELMAPGQDSLATGYLTAARRAGATEILQGRLLSGPPWGLGMEIQRMDLATGIVRSGYRVTASNRYALIDSMTVAIARDLRLARPGSSVAQATTGSPVAYRLYDEGLRAYYQFDYPAATRLMEAALQEDSTFAMAAYYVALLATGNGLDEITTRERALRLAARAPQRERLTISADLLTLNMEPAAIAVAESLTTRYPSDPRSFALYATALHYAGAWRDAVTAVERAIALDSASEPLGQKCRLCDDLVQLAEIYFWWDSLPAAERTAHRLLALRSQSHVTWHILVRSAAARNDPDALRGFLRHFDAASPMATSPNYRLHFLTLAEDYDELEPIVRSALDSPRPADAAAARWYRSIALRNQGRLDEAEQLARVRPLPNDLAEAMIALERGNPRVAVSILGGHARADQSMWPGGIRARHATWDRTLYGMALVAAGDTAALRPLADTVEELGRHSIYGRDRRAHHYLRGMLLIAEKRDADAVEELREAIHSPTNGFTRVNYELGKALLRLNRPGEAVPIVRAALHGDLDGSNLYITRTDLHELLAQAFDRLSMRDSAAMHYRAVAKAWEHADPLYRARREQATKYLARAPSTSASRR